MIKKLICMIKGHDKIFYIAKDNHYIVECKRCKEYNKWRRIGDDRIRQIA